MVSWSGQKYTVARGFVVPQLIDGKTHWDTEYEKNKNAKFNPPESLDFLEPIEWLDWKQRFSVDIELQPKWNKDDGEVQVAALIYTMVCEAENIFKSCTFIDDAQKKDYGAVLGGKFDSNK